MNNFIDKDSKYKSSMLKDIIILLIIFICAIGYMIYYHMPLMQEGIYSNLDGFKLILIATFIITSPLIFIFLNKMSSETENYFTVRMCRLLMFIMIIVLCLILFIISLTRGGDLLWGVLFAPFINRRGGDEAWPIFLPVVYLIFSINIGFKSYKRKH